MHIFVNTKMLVNKNFNYVHKKIAILYYDMNPVSWT